MLSAGMNPTLHQILYKNIIDSYYWKAIVNKINLALIMDSLPFLQNIIDFFLCVFPNKFVDLIQQTEEDTQNRHFSGKYFTNTGVKMYSTKVLEEGFLCIPINLPVGIRGSKVTAWKVAHRNKLYSYYDIKYLDFIQVHRGGRGKYRLHFLFYIFLLPCTFNA